MIEKIGRDQFKPKKINSDDQLFRNEDVVISDQFETMLEEHFLINNPKFRYDKNYSKDYEEFKSSFYGKNSPDKVGEWFYYPWLNQIVHFLPEEMHYQLRTGRNRFLITDSEQEKYYNAKIAVLGMSVGSHVALTIAMTGGAKEIRLADPDTLSGSNLNRIRTGFTNIGLSKTIAVARQIYEMNPYASIQIFSNGVTDNNLNEVISGTDLVVEEMDNPYFKIKVRYLARAQGIPVIMAADNGDGIIVDIERFDLNNELPILHGILGDIKPEDFLSLTPEEIPAVIAKMAGANLATIRMLESVLEVGNKLYSWPQLGNAATLCGSVLTYLARRLILKHSLESGRFEVNLDSIFEPNYHKETEERNKQRNQILKSLSKK